MQTFSSVPVDDVRAYWNARPCNVRHSTAPVGSREYFDEVEARKYLVEPHIPGFAEFERWAGKRVLEVGCGIGTDTVNFARAGASVTAIDVSDASLELAERRSRVFGVEDSIRFVHGNAEELTSLVPEGGFDLVYSFGVLHHTPHPERALAEIRRVIAPDGELRMMVYHRRSTKVAGMAMRAPWRARHLDRLIATWSEAQTGCPVTYSYTRRSGAQLLEGTGFAPTEVRVDHVFPYRIPDYVEYRYVKRAYFAWMPPALFRRLERRAGWHLLLTAVPA